MRVILDANEMQIIRNEVQLLTSLAIIAILHMHMFVELAHAAFL